MDQTASSSKIAIIGFGISGIASCRWAVHYGFEPTVFEKNSTHGGVWLTHDYVNCLLQTTKHSYHYSDMPMPDKYETYPHGFEVQRYLADYILHHDLNHYVQYNSTVQSIKKVGNIWEIIVNGERHEFPYVIISTGFYGKPKSSFSHTITPNSITNPIETFRDGRVIVVGNGPSGCDMACLAVESGAKSVQLLYRTPRWIFSRMLGSISLHFFTWRFFLTVAYYMPRPILRILLIMLYMVPLYLFGYYLKIDFPQEKVSRDNLVLNDTLYYYVHLGKIQMIRDPVQSITATHIITGQTKYEYDIAVNATGYQTGIPLIGYTDTIPKLYRNMIIPGDNTMCFIGFVASFSWVQVSELQCHWYFQQLLGRFQLPTATRQQVAIGQIIGRDYHDYAYLVYYYINLLRHDMGLRELNNWFSLPDRAIFAEETTPKQPAI